MPPAHSHHLSSHQLSQWTYSPTRYSVLPPCMDTPYSAPITSNTLTWEARHFLVVADDRSALAGTYSFTSTPLLHFFHAVNPPSSGGTISFAAVVVGMFLAPCR